MSRRLYIIEDEPGGRVLVERVVEGLREQEIHQLEAQLRTAYAVDATDSGIVLRDSINDLVSRGSGREGPRADDSRYDLPTGLRRRGVARP